MATYPAYEFTEWVTGETCYVVINGEKGPIVQHRGCPQMAPVTMELDAFYCTKCRFNGRISGAWVADLINGRQ